MSAFVTPSTSPKRMPLRPAGTSGAEPEQHAEPEERGDDDRDRDVAVQARDAPDERDEDGTDDEPRRAAEQQRDPQQRGEDEAGQHRVGERLGAVRAPREDDPAAQSAGDDAEQRRARRCRARRSSGASGSVSQSIMRDLVLVMMRREHRTGVALRAERDESRRRRCARSPRRLSALGGWPERDLDAVEAEHEVRRSRLLDVMGRHEQPAPLGGEVAEQRLQPLGARRVETGERLVEQQSGASWTSARATSTRWRCPPESSPNVTLRPVCQADAVAAPGSRAGGRRATGRRHQASATRRP